ncbi:MAG TPA: putative Ig domain-containing protein, partial [Gammaproteobacteria bacterium]
AGLWSPTHYLDADGTPVPAIVDGQVLEIPENTPAGTTIGNVRLDTPGLFAINPENFYADGGVYLMNSLPGDPFTVTRSGEIIVANPDALDYETSTGFQLVLSMQDVLVFHGSVPVDIRLKNENDNAPVPVKALPALNPGQGVTVDLSEYFTDPDGDPLSYTSGSLPPGLALDPATGMLAGVLPAGGVTKIAFDVSDGEHSVSATLSAAAPSGKSGGGSSDGLWLLALPMLAGWRRRGHAR